MTDYRYDYQLDDEINNDYMDYGITTCVINGFIYRGDDHKNIVLSSSPKFYGTYKSALIYTNDGDYFKRYTTMGSLRLLKLYNDNKNTISVLKFFNDVVLKNSTNKTDIKIAMILLQVLFGMINGSLDKFDLDDNKITTFLKSNGISDPTIILLIKIVNDLESPNTTTIPSRCSMRPLDKLLMKLLKKHLQPYSIDGTYYFQLPSYEQIKDLPELLCNKVNKNYEHGTTCVPSEICIFTPSTSLGGIIFWKKINGQLKRIFFHKKFKGYIEKNYNRLSTMDLYLLSKLYENKKKV